MAGGIMSPMLMAAFADAMAELADTMDRLDELAPDYIRDCLESATNPRLLNRPRQRPRELSALAAKLVREIADDALVRNLGRLPRAEERAA
jgi:hypothetical protein